MRSHTFYYVYAYYLHRIALIPDVSLPFYRNYMWN